MVNIKAPKPQIFVESLIMQYVNIILKNFIQKVDGRIKFPLKI